MSSDKETLERRMERMRGRNSKREHHQIEDRNFSVQISPLNNSKLIPSTSDQIETSRNNEEEEVATQTESKKNTQSTTSNVSMSSIASPPGTQEVEPSLSYGDSKLRTSTSTRFNQSSESIPQTVGFSRYSNRNNTSDQSLISPLSQNRGIQAQQNTSPEISPLKIRSTLTSQQDDISSSPPNSSPFPSVENQVIKPKFIENSELDKSPIAPKISTSSIRKKTPTARSKFKSISKVKPTTSIKAKATPSTSANTSEVSIEKPSKKPAKPVTPDQSPQKESKHKSRQIRCYKLSAKSLLTPDDDNNDNDNDNTFKPTAKFRSKVNPFDIALQSINKSTKKFERNLPIEIIQYFQIYQNTLNSILINFSDTWDTQTSIQQEIKSLDKQNTLLKDELLRLKREYGEVNGNLCRLKFEFKRDETVREQLESCHQLTTELQSLSTICNRNSYSKNTNPPDISRWFTLKSNLTRIRSRLGLVNSNNFESEEELDLENCMDLLTRLKLTNEELKSKLNFD